MNRGIGRSLLCLLLLSACASLGTPDYVKKGMTREQAVQTLGKNEAVTWLRQGSTEFLLYKRIVSLPAMYKEKPFRVFFIRFENGIVVGKGEVGQSEAARFQRIDPSFDLEKMKTNHP
jgi:hypothetical protein